MVQRELSAEACAIAIEVLASGWLMYMGTVVDGQWSKSSAPNLQLHVLIRTRLNRATKLLHATVVCKHIMLDIDCRHDIDPGAVAIVARISGDPFRVPVTPRELLVRQPARERVHSRAGL